MKITSHLKRTAEDVSDASKEVVATSQAAYVALIAVAAVAILALGVGLIALSEVRK
jgi:CHASE3 domain sensor protein